MLNLRENVRKQRIETKLFLSRKKLKKIITAQ